MTDTIYLYCGQDECTITGPGNDDNSVTVRWMETGITANVYESCLSAITDPLHGVLWPWMPCGDDSLPWVERDDDSDRFDTDDEAAHYVAELIGGRVMWAYVDQASDYTEQGDDLLPYAERDDPRDRLRPFVLPQTASLIYECRGFGERDCDFWMRERDRAIANLNKKEA